MLHTHVDQVPVQSFDWGVLQWLCNAEILSGAAQTVGLCTLKVGQGNPLHYHPNCEEILYVTQGTGKHLLDGDWVPVRAGSIVRIPIGMKHQLVNEGDEALVCFIAFSSGDRRTVFL